MYCVKNKNSSSSRFRIGVTRQENHILNYSWRSLLVRRINKYLILHFGGLRYIIETIQLHSYYVPSQDDGFIYSHIWNTSFLKVKWGYGEVSQKGRARDSAPRFSLKIFTPFTNSRKCQNWIQEPPPSLIITYLEWFKLE